MNKFLQIILFLILLSNVKIVNAIDKFNDSDFLQTYQNSIISNDVNMYATLVASKNDMDILIQQIGKTYPNCITSSETNYSSDNILKNFKNISVQNNNIEEIKTLQKSELKGCGTIEGIKLNIQIIYLDHQFSNRTLTFIKINNNYKLLFDIENLN